MTAPTTPPPRTARTPDDLLALVPVVLGFVPHDSIVMVTAGADHPFHARVDLPDEAADLPVVVELLLDPARHHGARWAAFVVYTEDALSARRAAQELLRSFASSGIGVLEVLRADGRRWWPAVGRRPGVPSGGVPYDVTTHPFSAEAVLEGRVLHGSREELRATLDADPPRVAGVVAALADTTAPEPGWVVALVARHCRDGTVPTDDEVARLLRGLLDPRVRDAAWSDLTRETADAHVGFWTEVVRRSPEPMVPGAAAVLGLAAWLSGHGALAWCAVDRCTDLAPGNRLAGLVAELLEGAVPPGTWADLRVGW